MDSDPKTIPAHRVVGGLWDGAPVRATWRGRDPWGEVDDASIDGTWHDGGLAVTLESGREVLSVDDADLALRLDDPMGLGLAGLAARVAGRLPWREAVRLGEWLPEPDVRRRLLLYASTYLALTDALCAAVGWAGGDEPALAGVAKWERWASEGPPHWVLTCPDLHHLAGDEQPALWHFECEHTDPLEALEAAWREVCCG